MPAHLERQLEKLKQMVRGLTTEVAEAVQHALAAFQHRDCELARQVIDHDDVINLTEIDIEEECLHTLACYQPVAMDLRYVVSILKVNNDLERIGDHAVKIAEITCYLANEPFADLMAFIDGMSEHVMQMLRLSLEALLDSDVDKATLVRPSDDRVDTIHRRMYEQVETAMGDNPQNIPQLIHIMNISRQLERIADLTVNIAEDVIYTVEGEILRHGRSVARSDPSRSL
ncbi:phosphate signaling complex protein PhoU [Planctomycetales bacterium ZRK34]|nr:phosphate signaling complex protein PhoU [Planctomycetales bacterium ZRK34]